MREYRASILILLAKVHEVLSEKIVDLCKFAMVPELLEMTDAQNTGPSTPVASLPTLGMTTQRGLAIRSEMQVPFAQPSAAFKAKLEAPLQSSALRHGLWKGAEWTAVKGSVKRYAK